MAPLAASGGPTQAQRAGAADETTGSLPAGVSSDPAPGATLNWPPVTLRVTFPTVPSALPLLVLRDADGVSYPAAVPSRLEGTTAVFAPPHLGKGQYTLSWDGPTAGTLPFAIMDAASADGQDALSVDPGNGSGGLLWVVVVVAALTFVAGAWLLRRRRALAVAVLVAAVLTAGLPVLLRGALSPTTEAGQGLFDRCATLQGRTQFACLVEVMAAAEGVDAVNAALAALDADRRFLVGYGEQICHDVAHEAARYQVAVSGSALASIDGLQARCGNGFAHGAIEGAARVLTTEAFTAEFTALCAADQWGTGPDREECSHGLGHAAMFRFNARLDESRDLCLTLSDRDHQADCLGGMAMSAADWFGNMLARIAPESSPSAALPPGMSSLEDFLGFCFAGPLSSMRTSAGSVPRDCFAGVAQFYSTPSETLVRLGALSDPSGLASWCAVTVAARPELADACFHGVGFGSGSRRDVEPPEFLSPCVALTTAAHRRSCLEGALSQVRSFVKGVSGDTGAFLAGLCEPLSVTERPACERFVQDPSQGVPAFD